MSTTPTTENDGPTGHTTPVATATPKAKMSKRQKAKLSRGIQYAILIIIAIAIAVFADWPKLIDSFGRIDIATGMFPGVITMALKNTVIYTLLGFALGFVIALVVALMRLSSVGVYRWLATIYIEFFRGLPALVVFLVMGFGLPVAFEGFNLPKLIIIMIALGLVSSAYMAETIRAGIQAVPKGQIEAARSLGMSSSRAMVTIVLPQAMRIILPPLTNELILLAKDSSLAYILGSSVDGRELAALGRAEIVNTANLTPFIVIALCYLIITIPLSYLSRVLERKYGSADSGVK
ncbi:amino acid ABC transporter membrane protein, PAAT family (TC 3.A.1.3.-) [Brevibacterium aurantiacum]|uniref:Amino acid ABC transporter membrane protein, PAAT family (TC 3.A.1.3.-) n=2 Tax=Brevibacterium aurantiacum TaxID=273384 RepID=A0A2H1HYL3_BREAU|nr:amino acid ABC transporter membrane protein, PAAT family (TC 3.A.1.3.-) [Brevibacterium aurantiacum]